MKVYSISTAPSYRQNFKSARAELNSGVIPTEVKMLGMMACNLFEYLDRDRVTYAHTNADGGLDIVREKIPLGSTKGDTFVISKESDGKNISVSISRLLNCGYKVSLRVEEIQSGRLNNVIYEFDNKASGVHNGKLVYSENLSAYSRASYGAQTCPREVSEEDIELFKKYVKMIINKTNKIKSHL